VKVPTVRLHRIPFTRVEVDRLLDIVKALSKNEILVNGVAAMQRSWPKCRPVTAGPGLRSMKLALYKAKVRELLDLLVMAKTGQQVPGPASLDAELLEAYKKSVK